MHHPENKSENRYIIPTITFSIAVVIPFLQYLFRRFDDNPFTGWHLVFLTTPDRTLVLVVLSGLLIATGLFKIALPRPRTFWLFLAGFLVALCFRNEPEINTVSARYVVLAKHLELYGIASFWKEWGHGLQAWMDLPAVPFFDGLLFKAFGESRIVLQLFTAALFGMATVVTYLIGKTLWDADTGFFGGMLLLGIPYLLTQTPLTLLDIHTMFFLTLSVYLFIRAIDAGGIGRIIAAACAISIAFFCKYSVWPMLSILPVTAAVYYFQHAGTHRREVLQRTLWVLLLFLLLVAVPLILMRDVIADQILLMQTFLRPSLGRWTESWTSIYLFQISPVITLAAIASLFLAAWKRDWKYLIVLWLPFLAVFFKIERVRYILPAFPLLTLMAARGIAGLRSRNVQKIIGVSVVAASLATALFLDLPFLEQWSAVNLLQAGRFLDTLPVDTVEAFAVPQQRYPVNPAIAVPLLDLSTHKRIRFHYVPGASTPDEDYHTSRFRDSWEYRNPRYYETGSDQTAGKEAVAVILADVKEPIPPDLTEIIGKLHHEKSFTTFFLFSANNTIVRVYW